MKLKKCENGHLYDADKFVLCPYCEGRSEGEIIQRTLETVKREDGKAPQSAAQTPKQEKEQKKDAPPQKQGPVAGWLVAVSGADKGREWKLTAGRSFIGGAEEPDISLSDPSVGAQRQAVLVYDAVNGEFIATPCETQQLFYINGSPCLAPTVMNESDLLKLGEVELALVPLKGPAFDALWGREAAYAE